MIIILHGNQVAVQSCAEELSSYLRNDQEFHTVVQNASCVTDYISLASVVKKSSEMLTPDDMSKLKIPNTTVLLFIVEEASSGVEIAQLEWLKTITGSDGSSSFDRLEREIGTELRFLVLSLADETNFGSNGAGLKLEKALCDLDRQRCLMSLRILNTDESSPQNENSFLSWRHNISHKLNSLRYGTIPSIQTSNPLDTSRKVIEILEEGMGNLSKWSLKKLGPNFIDASIEDMFLINNNIMKVILSFENISGNEFTAASSIRLLPENDPEITKEVITKLRLDVQDGKSYRASPQVESSTHDIVKSIIDLNALPSTDLVEQLSILSPNSNLGSLQNPQTIHSSIIALDDGDIEGLSSGAIMNLNLVLGLLPVIEHREYTIANDPQNQLSERKRVELNIKIIKDVRKKQSKQNSKVEHSAIPGLMSRHLLNCYKSHQESRGRETLTIRAQIANSIFSNIDYSSDGRTKQFILIGTGTGVNAASSILRQILHVNDKEGNLTQTKVMVVVGFRKPSDFLHEEFLKSAEGINDGVEVELSVAFSQHNTSKKVYVQRRLQELKPKIKAMIDDSRAGTAKDPIICIVGSNNMVFDVKETFATILGKQELERKITDSSYLAASYN